MKNRQGRTLILVCSTIYRIYLFDDQNEQIKTAAVSKLVVERSGDKRFQNIDITIFRYIILEISISEKYRQKISVHRYIKIFSLLVNILLHGMISFC